MAAPIVFVSAIAVVYAIARRRSADTPSLLSADVSARRGAYRIWLGLYLALTLYISLLPLEFRPVTWTTVIEHSRNIIYLQFDEAPWGAGAANFLMFVPLAYLATAVLTLGAGSWRMRAAAVYGVVGCCAGLSVGIELMQVWFWPRSISLNDVLAESLGGLFGAVLWLLLGTRVHGLLAVTAHWTQARWSCAAVRRIAGVCLALMGIYALVLVAASFYGCVWDTDPIRLTRRFHGFRQPPLSALYWGQKNIALTNVLLKVLLFVPLGSLGALAVWGSSLSQSRRRWCIAAFVLYAASVAFTVEVLQISLRPIKVDPSGIGHIADSGNVLLYTAGAAVGMFLTRRILPASRENEGRNPSTPARD